MEQQSTIRRLEQQLREKNRLLVEIQRNLQGKEAHIAALTSASLSLGSTAELLKHQLAHLTQVNLSFQGELAKLRPELVSKHKELEMLREDMKGKVQELAAFSGLEVRLKELEELQDRLIEEAATFRLENEQLGRFVAAARSTLPKTPLGCSTCSHLYQCLHRLYE